MSKFVEKYEFEKQPFEIQYYDEEPLKLTNDFAFFHNKNKFRKELVKLQNLFKDYVNYALGAQGIRDSFLSEKYTENYLIVVFTTPEIAKKADKIVETHLNESIKPGCFLINTNSEYMVLIAKDMDGLILGINTMEAILKQTLNDYFEQKKFDDYIKIRPFSLKNCLKID